MYLGLAVIDFHHLFQIITKFIRKMLLKIYIYLNFSYIINRIKQIECLFIFLQFIESLVLFLYIKIKSLNIKILITRICLLCFLYQTMQLTIEYLSFKTFVTVEFNYNKNDDQQIP